MERTVHPCGNRITAPVLGLPRGNVQVGHGQRYDQMQMSVKERKRALQQIELLRQRIEELGEVLSDLDESVAVLGKGIERGAPIIEALEDVGGTLTLPAMLETFDEFHAARQELRVALLAIARREGTTASEVARTLGISRQLASRLAVEAEMRS